MFSISGRNAQLDALQTAVFASAHSGYPGDGGANEVTGAGYSRQLMSFQSSTQGQRLMATAPTLTIPAGQTVQYVGFWKQVSSGEFVGYSPCAGSDRQFITNAATNEIFCPGHGYANNTRIVFMGSAPSGLTTGTLYFAINTSANRFQVSATAGGAAIPVGAPANSNGRVSRITPHAYGGQGKLNLNGMSISMGTAVPNSAPIWDNDPALIVLNVGETFDLKTLCTDADLDALIFMLSATGALPPAGEFTVNSAGILTANAPIDLNGVIFSADDGH